MRGFFLISFGVKLTIKKGQNMPVFPEILQRIADNDPTLTSLDLEFNPIGDEEVKSLACALSTNTTLTSLKLIRSRQIGDEGVKSLANALKNNETLKEIDLCDNEIGDEGFKSLANALKNNETLREVNLDYNRIGYEGAKSLASALSTNTNLRLNLSYNQIGDSGAGAIVNALRNNKTMIRIDLRANQIGDSGAGEIANALENNETLRVIDLRYNQIGDEGAKSLANALKNNKTLRGIGLRYNQIGNEGAIEIANALSTNTNLINITLFDNKIAYRLIEGIRGLCERNLEIADAISDYSKSVLAPRLVRASVKDGGNEIILSSEVIYILDQVTQKHLFKNLTPEQIVEFSKHWHQPLQQTKSNGSKDFGKESWSLLFGEDKKEIDVTLEGMEGWKLVTLNNSGELKAEGKKLDHCVGGYAGKCLNEYSHIISVVNPEGNSVSTIEIEAYYSGRNFKEIQHMGRGNSYHISQESKRVAEWLYNEIKEGRISINYDALAASKLARDEEARSKIGGQAKMVIGFDPLNSDKIRKVRAVFKEMLPEGNEQLKKNFSSLVSLEEISIEGQKYNLSALEKAIKADLTQEEKDKESSVQMSVIVGKIQESLNVIFGENVLQAVISLPAEGKKTKKNQFGQVVLKAENPLEGDILNKIEEIFNGKVSDDGYVIDNQTPKQVMGKLKNHTTNLQIDDIKKLEPQESKTQLSSQEIGLATPAPVLNNQAEITFGEEEFKEGEVQTMQAEQAQKAEQAPRTSTTTTDQEAVRLAGCLPQKSCLIS